MNTLIDDGWRFALEDELEKPYVSTLKQFVFGEVEQGKVVYPPIKEIFNSFLYTPFEKVRVVLVGQDPYHGPGQAHGLSFSVPQGVAIPPSLKNIYKELVADLGVPYPEHGSLISWAKQGVLLLNAILTVREGSPKSHYGMGWEIFTDAVISKLYDREDPLVFILWGKSAEEKCKRILNQKKAPHLVLKAAHPSPFSMKNFFGCRHFSQTNNFLQGVGKSPIDWRIPPI